MDPVGRMKVNANGEPDLGPSIDAFMFVEATGTVGPWVLGAIVCGLCGGRDAAIITLKQDVTDVAAIALECPSCGQAEARFELLEDPKL